jgi:hypothetical protein
MMEKLALCNQSLMGKEEKLKEQTSKTQRYADTVEVLRKELQTVRGENEKLGKSNVTLRDENEGLIQRLLKVKNSAAQEMNQMNALFDTLQKKHKQSLVSFQQEQ